MSTAISVGAKFDCLFAYVIILPREKILGGDCCVRDVIRRACAPGLVAGFACLLCWTRSENVSSLLLVFLFLDYYNNCTNLSNAVCEPLGPDITIPATTSTGFRFTACLEQAISRLQAIPLSKELEISMVEGILRTEYQKVWFAARSFYLGHSNFTGWF